MIIPQNQMYFYIPMSYQKKKLENNFISNCIKKNKIPRNKLTKEVKDTYTENFKTLIRETEDNTNKWKKLCL